MTINEAIKWLGRIAAQDKESGRPECVAAEMLGIEALEREKLRRKDPGFVHLGFLPGETEE